jgi:CubicO group peptidase (beta-lactamase class C family)
MKKNFKNFKRITLIYILILINILVLSSCSAIPSFKKKKNEEQAIAAIQKYMAGCQDSNYFTGSVLVARNGKVLLNEAYGLSDRENNIKNTPQTRYMIGSLTKQFTAMAIMQLEEKKKLNVTDTIDKYINGFPHGKEITIHQLLSHTSGLPREIQTLVDFTTMPKTLGEAISMIKSKGFSLLSEPGTTYSYSNTGYILLGYIIEKTSGTSYYDYMEKNIFKPLKMTNTGFGYDKKNNSQLAISYDTFGKNLISDSYADITSSNYVDMSLWPFSAGAIYSTTEDLYKWDRTLYTTKLAKKKTIEKLFTPVKSSYGYGWGIESITPKKVYSHNGLLAGFNSKIIRMVDDDTCIIILSNVDNGYILESISNNIRLELLKN